MSQFLSDNEIKHLTSDGTNYPLSAGTSDVNSESVDMANYDEVTFLVTLGTISSSGSVDVKVQESSNNSDWADLAGSAQAQAGDTKSNKMIAVSVRKPLKRYLRLAITRGDGGNSVIQSVHAVLRGPRKSPVSQSTGAGQFNATPEQHISPVAGTA